MSIAVTCGCGKRMSAPPHLAGKTVRCPGCQSPLAIPVAEASSPITVACPCGKRFGVKAELAGKQVRCPGCKSPVRVPDASTSATDTGGPFPVACQCGQRFEAQPHLIGKQVPCPSCQQPISIARPSAAAAASAAPTPDPFGLNDTLGQGDPFADTNNDPFGDIGGSGTSSSSGDDLFGDLPAVDSYAPAAPTVAATPAPRPASSSQVHTGEASEYIAKAQAEQAMRRESDQSEGTGMIFSGIGMIVGAVVWFFGGLAFGYIFFYPPILLVIGIGTLINGIGQKMAD